MAKRPSFQFYPGDWMKDPALRRCSPATRGIWIDLICAIYELDEGGSITGTAEQLARIAGCLPDELRNACYELSVTKTSRVTENNGEITVTCRRLAEQANIKSENALRQARYRERKASNKESNKKITFPSSSSSSTSVKKDTSNEVSKKKGTRIPEPFLISEEMREFARKRRPDVDVDLETEIFRNYWSAKARDGTKLDWIKTWENWILRADSRSKQNGQTKHDRLGNAEIIRQQRAALEPLRGIDPIEAFAIRD